MNMLQSVPLSKTMKTEHGGAASPGDSIETNAHEKSAPTASLPIPHFITITNILELNDDCLIECFSMERVLPVDLCSLARTCTKLKEIATTIFERSNKICDWNNLAVEDSLMASTVLNTFGSTISELRLDGSSYSLTGVINSIIKHCSCLKSLTIESYTVPDCQSEITKMALLFEKLKTLRLENVYVEGSPSKYGKNFDDVITRNGNLLNVFHNCHSLVNLKVTACYVLQRNIFENFFPQLQHFEYDFIHSTEWQTKGFVFRHRHLKSFSLYIDDYNVPDNLKVLSTNCKRLEKLWIVIDTGVQDDEESLRYLEKFEYLAELKLSWMNHRVTTLLQNLQSSLQVLDLKEILCCPELIPTISRMETLRVLKLCTVELYDLNVLGNIKQLIELHFKNSYPLQEIKFDLVKIVEPLVKLKKFTLNIYNFRITEHLYAKIVSVVERRPDPINRYLEIDCPTTNNYDASLCSTVVFKSLE